MCLDTLYRFIFNSDYPTDKVIYLEEGELTLNNSGDGSAKLNVPQERAPYLKGCVSFDNWQSAIPFGSMRKVENGIVVDIVGVTISYGGDHWIGDVSIDVSSHTKKNVPVKYRVWGLWAENDTGLDANKNTTISKTKLAFNTENNYPKLIKDGIAKAGDTVAHNLGKIPFVDAWYDTYYGFYTLMERPTPVNSGYLGNGAVQCVQADENNVYFTDPFGDGHLYYYYRIYA